MLDIGIAQFAQPSLVMVADRDGLALLRSLIDADAPADLADVDGVRLWSLQHLVVEPGAAAAELHRHPDGGLRLRIGAAERDTILASLQALADAPSPAHGYLEFAINPLDLDVIVSLGEYVPATLFS